MLPFLRILHVLAVSLWFGSVAFFTVAGLLIFQAFSDVSRLPGNERPLWLPEPAEFATPSPGEGFPDPLRLEQGSRAAGVAVSRIFPLYYGMQTACGVIGLVTAVLLARGSTGTRHRMRRILCLVGLITVLGGWWLEMRVADQRVPRNELTDRLLKGETAVLEEARQARATFGRWHGYSLMQNFATLLLTAGITLVVPGLSKSE